jgi:hypothetical protein
MASPVLCGAGSILSGLGAYLPEMQSIFHGPEMKVYGVKWVPMQISSFVGVEFTPGR